MFRSSLLDCSISLIITCNVCMACVYIRKQISKWYCMLIVRRILWNIWCLEKGSVRYRCDDRKLERMMYLEYTAFSDIIWRNNKIAVNFAVSIAADFGVRRMIYDLTINMRMLFCLILYNHMYNIEHDERIS